MRDIKFRAWVTGYSDDGSQLSYMCDVLDYRKPYGDEPASISTECGGSFWKDDQFTLMQFTDLCDKNGTEIYEGDIVVKYTHVENDYTDDNYYSSETRGVVSLTGSGGAMINRCIRKETYDTEADLGEDKKIKHSVNVVSERCVVLGNIHENPELLGDDTP